MHRLTIYSVTVSIIDDDITPTPTPIPVPIPVPTPGTTNTFPVAIADIATTVINTPVIIPVLANDVDLDEGDLIQIESFENPTKNGGTISLDDNATLDTEDDLLIYTPAENFLGTDSFNYTITDGQATGTATVTVEVEFLRQNLPPLEFIVETRVPPLPNATVNRLQALDNGQILRATHDADEIIGTAQDNLLFGLSSIVFLQRAVQIFRVLRSPLSVSDTYSSFLLHAFFAILSLFLALALFWGL